MLCGLFKCRNLSKFNRIFNGRFYSANKPDLKFKRKMILGATSLVSVVAGFSAFLIYKSYKLKAIEDELARNKSVKQYVGTPLIGGEFDLIDHNGIQKSIADFKGKWLLVYFGFCNCPDICPDQLDKIVMVIERLGFTKSLPPIQALFVTVDPERDTPDIMREYIKEFSHKILGLTGKIENIKAVTKAYRVYYSMGPKDEFGDYIVDHAIIMYLIGPNGEFIDYYGQNKSVPEICTSIQTHMKEPLPVAQ